MSITACRLLMFYWQVLESRESRLSESRVIPVDLINDSFANGSWGIVYVVWDYFRVEL